MMLSVKNNLKQLYALKASVRRSDTKRRYYHYQIQEEKLRLVESGECPKCVENYCSYLVYGKKKICFMCESGQEYFKFTDVIKPMKPLRVHPRYNETVRF